MSKNIKMQEKISHICRDLEIRSRSAKIAPEEIAKYLFYINLLGFIIRPRAETEEDIYVKGTDCPYPKNDQGYLQEILRIIKVVQKPQKQSSRVLSKIEIMLIERVCMISPDLIEKDDEYYKNAKTGEIIHFSTYGNNPRFVDPILKLTMLHTPYKESQDPLEPPESPMEMQEIMDELDQKMVKAGVFTP